MLRGMIIHIPFLNTRTLQLVRARERLAGDPLDSDKIIIDEPSIREELR